MTPAHPGTVQSYPWQWLAGFALFLVGIVYLLFLKPAIPVYQLSERPIGSDSMASDTYLVLHFPPVYSQEYSAPSKAESWLAALNSKGYRPALLSDVHAQLSAGKKLPEKTVVILFDPGYRTTFEVMAPLLAKYKFPAVWVTSNEKNAGSDTRFVSNHALNAMKKSGTWDVARVDANSSLVIESKGDKKFVIGNGQGAWRVGAGRRALNRGTPTAALNRLHVNWNWNGQQIIDRLKAEEPLQGESFLTFKKIENYNWGVAVPTSVSSQDTTFTLKAPTDSRTAQITWLGTKGITDADAHLQVTELTGELWLLFRSDESIGENVGISFSNRKVSLNRERHFETQQVTAIEVPSLVQPANFSATVVLRGNNATVYVNDVPVLQATTLSGPWSSEGIVRATVYDKIVGAAQASVKLTLTPQ